MFEHRPTKSISPIKERRWLLALLLMPFLLATCSGDDGTAPQTLQGPALIMFYTENWLPWQEMTPIVDGLESDFSGRAAVLQLDANETANAERQQQYGMRGHPTFVVLDSSGRVVQTFIGPQTRDILHEALTTVTVSAN